MILRADTPHDSRAETLAEHYREESIQSLAHIQAMNTTNENTVIEALASIAKQAKQAAGHAGSYHAGIALSLDDEGAPRVDYWTVTHFAPGTNNHCTQGMEKTVDAAIASLVSKLGTPAIMARRLREEAAAKLRAAERLEAEAADKAA